MIPDQTKDLLYAQPQAFIGDFVFNEDVANVFDDMIRRSVPGYGSIIHMTGVLAGQYTQANSFCYDLGCSLGAGTLSMRRYIHQENVKIIAVDNSESMVGKCRQNIVRSNLTVPVEIFCQDITETVIKNASFAAINFTLQFIHPDHRADLIQRIYDGLLPGGVLVISEKINFSDAQEQNVQTELHHSFKKLNGYSDLEIAQKRTALENVLIPDTLETHLERLRQAGFKQTHVWFRCFNFVSIIAFK
ncbi:MAG: carboxy-S-adenosyl-L-methionine synthase CmoA [Candidatus Omnitrophica bacterium]|nr:carboxy-S-adenosyl-L-methionine synthase CmoA [Candidatus Omnitrophota bacterium]